MAHDINEEFINQFVTHRHGLFAIINVKDEELNDYVAFPPEESLGAICLTDYKGYSTFMDINHINTNDVKELKVPVPEQHLGFFIGTEGKHLKEFFKEYKKKYFKNLTKLEFIGAKVDY